MRARYALLLAAGLACHVTDSDASAVASGRNWQISIDSLVCEAAGALITIGTQIRYLGPGGAVEAPASQLVDGNAKPYVPKSLVWRGGSKQLAAWFSTGGLANLPSGTGGQLQLKFDVRDPSGDLKLEFGDIEAFSLTRRGASASRRVCESILKPGQIRAPRRARPARIEGAKRGLKAYRAAYPCLPGSRAAWQTTEAPYPPYLPEQLLVFGRGYLPNVRQIELPMGKAAAQSYAYAGPDDLSAVEDAARRAVTADFSAYGSSKHYAFNWGVQKAASGNDLYSIGVYAVRTCAR